MALPESVEPRTPLVDVAQRGASPRLRRATHLVLTAITATVAALGAMLLFVSKGELWLDEAQTVSISDLSIDQLLSGLREDGSPPLYYVVLHGWMSLFGDGTHTVRALSGMFGLACLPIMWLTARHLAGTRVAWAATVLLATSPFAIRYGTETRMYSLVVLLVLLGLYAVLAALDRPSVVRLALVSIASAALLLTHYWALYLVAFTVLVLLVGWRRAQVHGRVVVAVALGGIAFVPWLPTFLHQASSTGAPWAARASFGDLVDVLQGYGAPSGLDSAGWILWLLLLGLVVLGVFGHRRRSGAVELRWRSQNPEAALGAVAGGTLALALLAGIVGDSPVTARYTAVVFPLVLIMAAFGLSRLSRAAFTAVLVVAAVAGVLGGYDASTTARTAAPRVAAELERRATADDVVLYCPDQLGPSTSRLLHEPFRQVTFPSFGSPARVDWDDYLDRVNGADLDAFAARVDAMTTGDVWLVTAPNYMTTSGTCSSLRDALEDLRPRTTEIVPADGRFFEQAQLFRLRPS
jgi:hypothetical protein